MREIKFRGKRVDTKEWTYGYYFMGSTGVPYILVLHDDISRMTEFYDVIPETVGQFTGLLDKTGKKIFEGDILRFPAKDEYEKTTFVGYEVFYHDNDCAYTHIWFQMNRMHFYGYLCGGECRAKLLPKYTSQMVIVGNIHDNPELLSGPNENDSITKKIE